MTMTEDELIQAVLAQLDDETLFTRVRVLAQALAKELIVLTKDELATELLRVRFALMRINGVLQSEQRADHVLEVAQRLVDERIRAYAPEAE